MVPLYLQVILLILLRAIPPVELWHLGIMFGRWPMKEALRLAAGHGIRQNSAEGDSVYHI